jgi:hypothetical protein
MGVSIPPASVDLYLVCSTLYPWFELYSGGIYPYEQLHCIVHQQVQTGMNPSRKHLNHMKYTRWRFGCWCARHVTKGIFVSVTRGSGKKNWRWVGGVEWNCSVIMSLGKNPTVKAGSGRLNPHRWVPGYQVSRSHVLVLGYTSFLWGEPRTADPKRYSYSSPRRAPPPTC